MNLPFQSTTVQIFYLGPWLFQLLQDFALKLKAITKSKETDFVIAYEIEKDQQLLLKLRNSKESNQEKKLRPNNEINQRRLRAKTLLIIPMKRQILI